MSDFIQGTERLEVVWVVPVAYDDNSMASNEQRHTANQHQNTVCHNATRVKPQLVSLLSSNFDKQKQQQTKGKPRHLQRMRDELEFLGLENGNFSKIVGDCGGNGLSVEAVRRVAQQPHTRKALDFDYLQ